MYISALILTNTQPFGNITKNYLVLKSLGVNETLLVMTFMVMWWHILTTLILQHPAKHRVHLWHQVFNVHEWEVKNHSSIYWKPYSYFSSCSCSWNTMKSMLISFPHPTQMKHLVDSCKCIRVWVTHESNVRNLLKPSGNYISRPTQNVHFLSLFSGKICSLDLHMQKKKKKTLIQRIAFCKWGKNINLMIFKKFNILKYIQTII